MSNQTNVKTEPGQLEMDWSGKSVFRGGVSVSSKHGNGIVVIYNGCVYDQNDKVLLEEGSVDPVHRGSR